MVRKRQIVVACALALSALAAWGREADADSGLRLRDSGWTASLFVSPAERQRLLDATPPEERPASVNGRLSRSLTRRSRLSVDVLNVFDRPAAAAPGDFPAPAPAGRGLRLGFRLVF